MPDSPLALLLGLNSGLGWTLILHWPFLIIHSPNSSRLPLLFRFFVGGGLVAEGARLLGFGLGQGEVTVGVWSVEELEDGEEGSRAC